MSSVLGWVVVVVDVEVPVIEVVAGAVVAGASVTAIAADADAIVVGKATPSPVEPHA